MYMGRRVKKKQEQTDNTLVILTEHWGFVRGEMKTTFSLIVYNIRRTMEGVACH